MDGDSRLWAIILAGGAGSRMISLTRAMHGGDVPKQFAVLTGHRSLLQATVDRIGGLVPDERTVVVVTAEQDAAAVRQLADWPAIDILAQPSDRGTAPGLLLALTRIFQQDPMARVVVLPADHHVADATPMLRAIEQAASASRSNAGEICTLGATPDEDDPEYGWIVPGEPLHRFGLRAVIRLDDAASNQRGPMPPGDPLWATSIVVASATSLWWLLADCFPAHVAAIEKAVHRASSPRVIIRRLEAGYASLEPASYDTALARSPSSLSVVPFGRTGWCDLDTPRRVLQRMRNTPELRQSLRRSMTMALSS
jgi:mannose-1-phosphate guanylyltransferase